MLETARVKQYKDNAHCLLPDQVEKSIQEGKYVPADKLISLANNDPDRLSILVDEKVRTLRDLGPRAAVVLFSGAGYSGLMYKTIAEIFQQRVIDHRCSKDKVTGSQIATGQPGIKGVDQSQLAYFGVSAGVSGAFLMSACNTPDKLALLQQFDDMDRFSLTTSPIGIGGDLSPYASMLDYTLLRSMQYDPRCGYAPPVFSLMTHAETGDTHLMWNYERYGKETPGRIAAASSSALPLGLRNNSHFSPGRYIDGAGFTYGLHGIDIARALFPEATLITIDALGTDINNSVLAHAISTLHGKNTTTVPDLRISVQPAHNSIDYALRILPFFGRQLSAEDKERITSAINRIPNIMNENIQSQTQACQRMVGA